MVDGSNSGTIVTTAGRTDLSFKEHFAKQRQTRLACLASLSSPTCSKTAGYIGHCDTIKVSTTRILVFSGHEPHHAPPQQVNEPRLRRCLETSASRFLGSALQSATNETDGGCGDERRLVAGDAPAERHQPQRTKHYWRLAVVRRI